MSGVSKLALTAVLVTCLTAQGAAPPQEVVAGPGSLPTTSSATYDPPVKYFAGSGTMQRGPQSCILIFTADTGQAYTLADPGDFWWGDRVYVTGWVNEWSWDCFPAIMPRIEDNTIQRFFEGPGTMAHGPQSCILVFTADSGETYTLDETDDFWWQDRVYVTGPVDEESMDCFPVKIPAIRENTIQPYFEGSGTMAIGPQSCTLIFVADAGQGYKLDDTGDFLWGDRVYVTGAVDLDSLACWPVTMPAIRDNTIQAWFSACGTLGPGPQGCPAFTADTGEFFVLETAGGFEPGDHVLVEGIVVEESTLCLPWVGPGLEEQTIEPCP